MEQQQEGNISQVENDELHKRISELEKKLEDSEQKVEALKERLELTDAEMRTLVEHLALAREGRLNHSGYDVTFDGVPMVVSREASVSEVQVCLVVKRTAIEIVRRIMFTS